MVSTHRASARNIFFRRHEVHCRRRGRILNWRVSLPKDVNRPLFSVAAVAKTGLIGVLDDAINYFIFPSWRLMMAWCSTLLPRIFFRLNRNMSWEVNTENLLIRVDRTAIVGVNV